MTSLLENGHKSDDLNNSYSVEFDTHSGLTLDNIVNVLITGYFNGYNVEIRLKEEMSLLYQMGQFGNEFSSNSKSYSLGSQDHNIMRKRQFLKRTTWYNKFQDKTETQESCKLLNDIRKLTEKIVSDGNKNVIDLVSSDESDTNDDNLENNFFHTLDDHELVVVVPNSDSEGENYFENFKPKCCANRIKTVDKLILSLQEAYFLAYVLGCLQIINLKDELLSVEQCWKLFNEIDCLFTPKYIVYHYFKAKGYCVKPGIKFGGDYCKYILAEILDFLHFHTDNKISSI